MIDVPRIERKRGRKGRKRGGKRKRGRKEEKRRGEEVRKDGESDWNMEKMDREQVREYGEQEELDRDWGNDSRERGLILHTVYYYV